MCPSVCSSVPVSPDRVIDSQYAQHPDAGTEAANSAIITPEMLKRLGIMHRTDAMQSIFQPCVFVWCESGWGGGLGPVSLAAVSVDGGRGGLQDPVCQQPL